MATKDKRQYVDKIARTSGTSTFKNAIGNMFSGIDARGMGSPYQKNTDGMGLVFFTRPDLNLSYDNISGNRVLAPMVRDAPSGTDEVLDSSMHRAIKLMLSPRLTFNGMNTTNLINVQSPFMDIVGNLLQSLSGWNDISLDSYVSPEGMRKESWSMMDSVAEVNGVFNLTASFANVEGDPITNIFHYWSLYMGLVYTGEIVPWPDNIITNTKDYETRIWRLVLDKNQKYVRKIASCFAYPKATPIGLNLNYNRENKFATDNDQVSLPFECQGAEYNDPILYEEFNNTVLLFNNKMKPENRSQYMTLLKSDEVGFFNFKAVPWIDVLTLELQWWVTNEDYQRLVELMKDDTPFGLSRDAGYLGSVDPNEDYVNNMSAAQPPPKPILDTKLKDTLPSSSSEGIKGKLMDKLNKHK